jgi:hypothetical protein
VVEAFGVVSKNTNFGIRANIVSNLLEVNNIGFKKPNTKKLPKTEFGTEVVELHPIMIQIQQIFAPCDDPLSPEISG